MSVHLKLDFICGAFANIIHHMGYLGDQVGSFQNGRAANFGKPGRYQVQAIHIFLKFRCDREVFGFLFEHFDPALQGGNGGTQLVRRFLGHARPDLVLGGSVALGYGINDKEDEQRHNKKLHDRVVANLAQQGSVPVIVPVGGIGAVTELNFQRNVLGPEFT